MHTPRHTVPTEDHDAQKSRLEHKSHGAFESENIAEEFAANLRKGRPVGSELEFQRQSRDDADTEIQ